MRLGPLAESIGEKLDDARKIDWERGVIDFSSVRNRELHAKLSMQFPQFSAYPRPNFDMRTHWGKHLRQECQ